MGKRKIKRISLLRPEPETEHIQFSFKHLDSEHPDFRIENCPAGFLQALLCRIREYESYTEQQFRDVNHQDDRMLFYFQDSAYPDGFTSLDIELQSEHGWEIKVAPDAKRHSPEAAWRAYGILVGNVFYFVWLDPKHRLFPDNHPKHAINKKKQ
jgi:hypothetical protein